MPYSGEHLDLVVEGVQPPDNVIVTPMLARKWLATTLKNRLINRNTVLTYSADMKKNQWVFTGDPLRFDRNGHLIDGQHRLSALAGLPEGFALEFVVIRGLPPEAQFAMDQGRKRTSGQQLDLSGYKNGNALAAGIRLLLMWEADRLFTRAWDEDFAVTNAAILEWAHDNDDRVQVALPLFGRVTSIGMMPSVGMCFGLRLGRDYPELVTEFFKDMDELVGQPEGSPLITLTKRLRRARTDKLKLDKFDQLGFTISTWNAWTDNRRLRKLVRPAGNQWTAENFPRLDI